MDAPDGAERHNYIKCCSIYGRAVRPTPKARRDEAAVRLTAGMRLRSTACETEVIITRGPDRELDLSCGGAPMVSFDTDAPRVALDDAASDGAQMGKRYVDDSGELELLCTKPGRGSLALDGTPLTIRGAKPLPSSD
jgi:hypothetical protein